MVSMHLCKLLHEHNQYKPLLLYISTCALRAVRSDCKSPKNTHTHTHTFTQEKWLKTSSTFRQNRGEQSMNVRDISFSPSWLKERLVLIPQEPLWLQLKTSPFLRNKKERHSESSRLIRKHGGRRWSTRNLCADLEKYKIYKLLLVWARF